MKKSILKYESHASSDEPEVTISVACESLDVVNILAEYPGWSLVRVFKTGWSQVEVVLSRSKPDSFLLSKLLNNGFSF